MHNYTTNAGAVSDPKSDLPSNGRIFFDFYLEQTPLTVEARAIAYRLAFISHSTGELVEFGGTQALGCAVSLSELGKTLQASWPNSAPAVIRRKVSEALKEMQMRGMIWILPADRGAGQLTNIYLWQPKDNWILTSIEVGTRNVRTGRTLARSSEDLARPITGEESPEALQGNVFEALGEEARSSEDLALEEGTRSSEDLALDPRRITARSSEDHTPYINLFIDLEEKEKERTPPLPPSGGSLSLRGARTNQPGTQPSTSAPGQPEAEPFGTSGRSRRDKNVPATPQALLKTWKQKHGEGRESMERLYQEVPLPGKFDDLYQRYRTFCQDQGVPGREGDKPLAAAAWWMINDAGFYGWDFPAFCRGSGIWKAERLAAQDNIGIPALHIFLVGNQVRGFGPYWLRPLEAEQEPQPVPRQQEPEGHVFADQGVGSARIPTGQLDAEIGRTLRAKEIDASVLMSLLRQRYGSHYPANAYLTASGLKEEHKRDLLQFLQGEESDAA